MNENQARIKNHEARRREAQIEDFFDAVHDNDATWATMSEEERASAQVALADTEQVEASYDAGKPLHAC